MMNRSRLILLVIALVAIIIIVAAAWMFMASPQACITETEWTLVSYGSKSNPQKALSNVKATATFSEGKVTGIASCNNYFTSYEVDGSSLRITSPIGTTLMMCEEDVMQQERAFLSALETSKSYMISGNTLEIEYNGGTLTFTK
ncbi:META domain-containing protein [[Eubacterium] cellulosolvens]